MVERRLIRAAAALALWLVAGCVATRPVESDEPASGYLRSETVARLASQAPAPAAPDETDLAVFEEAGPGTDRWWLATAHAELRPPWAAQHFDCALSTRIASRPRPALTRLMGRLSLDVAALARSMTERAPDVASRPFVAAAGLEPCVRVADQVRASGSWPPSAAILSGAYGELFATLAPDAAQPVRRTAREIGFSRVVCRMNWPADVEAGLRTGAELFRAAQEQPEFQTDFQAARLEVAEARAEGLSSAACAAERAALRQWKAP